MRITKNNSAYPLIRDTFSVLGSSKCEVLSVLDIKRCHPLLDRQKIQEDIVEYVHILVVHPICTKGCPWD